MTEDELGDMYFMFSVDLNRNSLSIVRDTDFLSSNANIYFLHFFISLEVVGCIDKNLVEYFVESRDIFDFFLGELISINNPHEFLCLSD